MDTERFLLRTKRTFKDMSLADVHDIGKALIEEGRPGSFTAEEFRTLGRLEAVYRQQVEEATSAIVSRHLQAFKAAREWVEYTGRVREMDITEDGDCLFRPRFGESRSLLVKYNRGAHHEFDMGVLSSDLPPKHFHFYDRLPVYQWIERWETDEEGRDVMLFDIPRDVFWVQDGRLLAVGTVCVVPRIPEDVIVFDDVLLVRLWAEFPTACGGAEPVVPRRFMLSQAGPGRSLRNELERFTGRSVSFDVGGDGLAPHSSCDKVANALSAAFEEQAGLDPRSFDLIRAVNEEIEALDPK